MQNPKSDFDQPIVSDFGLQKNLISGNRNKFFFLYYA